MLATLLVVSNGPRLMQWTLSVGMAQQGLQSAPTEPSGAPFHRRATAAGICNPRQRAQGAPPNERKAIGCRLALRRAALEEVSGTSGVNLLTGAKKVPWTRVSFRLLFPASPPQPAPSRPFARSALFALLLHVQVILSSLVCCKLATIVVHVVPSAAWPQTRGRLIPDPPSHGVWDARN